MDLTHVEMHIAPLAGPFPYKIERFYSRKSTVFLFVMILTCASCGKRYKELVHQQEFNRRGILVLQLYDEELYERYPPESAEESRNMCVDELADGQAAA